jgi:hypothetical protein
MHAMTKDSKFADLRRRMAAIERELHARIDNAKSVVASDACSLVDMRLKNPKNAPLCLTFSQAQDVLQGGDRAPHLFLQ